MEAVADVADVDILAETHVEALAGEVHLTGALIVVVSVLVVAQTTVVILVPLLAPIYVKALLRL